MKPMRWIWSTAVAIGIALLVSTIVRVGANNLVALQVKAKWRFDIAVSITECRSWANTSESFAQMQFLLQVWPNDERLWLNVGRLLWLNGRCEEASAAWQQASALSSDDIIARLLDSLSLYATGKSSLWDSQLSPTEASQFSFAVGQFFDGGGDYQQAAAWYERTLILQPNRRAVERLAELYVLSDSSDAAIAALGRFAAALPEDSADHWWAQGQAAKYSGDWPRAAEAYQQAAKLSPQPYVYWMQSGEAYEHFDLVRAESVFQLALQAQPKVIWPYLSLGHVRLNQHDMLGSLEWYLKAEALSPQDVNTKYYLGYLYYTQNDFARAQEYFQAALVLADQAHAPSLYYMAQIAYKEQDVHGAERYLARAVEVSTNMPLDWAVQLGDWFLKDGNIQKAQEYYRLALSWDPNSEVVLKRLDQLGMP